MIVGQTAVSALSALSATPVTEDRLTKLETEVRDLKLDNQRTVKVLVTLVNAVS